MFDANPNLIQDLDGAHRSASDPPTPLVLIHDGGGTIFGYHCLGKLERPVYGIYNPHFGTENTWSGGIPEMAVHYVRLVRAAVPEGPIFLGGWSLGGLISFEMSRLLADDPALRVKGVMLIDSPCPPPRPADPGPSPPPPIKRHVGEWSETTPPEIRAAVSRCFDEAFAVVEKWTPPTWEDVRGPPSVFLLRASAPIPAPLKGASALDTNKNDLFLGWRKYREDLVAQVKMIPGHHYTIFALENLAAITEAIRTACHEMESWGQG